MRSKQENCLSIQSARKLHMASPSSLKQGNLQVEAMQRRPAKDILEEEEDGKYTKSGAQVKSTGHCHCGPS